MQINLNILTENNHSSLLSKNVPTADNALLQYMQKVTQGTNNADTEDKKQQKMEQLESEAAESGTARQKTDGAGDGISADELSG